MHSFLGALRVNPIGKMYHQHNDGELGLEFRCMACIVSSSPWPLIGLLKQKLIFKAMNSLNQNICYGYSKELSCHYYNSGLIWAPKAYA